MIKWTVYSRPECSLCEQLLADLEAVIGSEQAGRIDVIDVDSDAELRRKYGMRIPVLLADGEFLCAYRLDEARVREYLKGGS